MNAKFEIHSHPMDLGLDGGEVWRAYRVNYDPETREETLEYVTGTAALTREECAEQLAEVTES